MDKTKKASGPEVSYWILIENIKIDILLLALLRARLENLDKSKHCLGNWHCFGIVLALSWHCLDL
jgi:hypothetical protein